MAETDIHRDDMIDLIRSLQAHFAGNPDVYVSGNLLVFYEEGNRRKHVAPDVFVVRGVPKRRRENYLIWEEGKAPEFIIELTSQTTSSEDLKKKFNLYRDALRVREYFLFDPREEYLRPSFRGFRLVNGDYVPIEAIEGRLPSEVVGLHLERDGLELRLVDPTTGRRLPTPEEARIEAEAEARRAIAEARRAVEDIREREQQALLAQAGEIQKLREEIEALRRGGAESGPSA